MFELLTTDEFATWYSRLAAEPAEEVAATLEVITQLGAGREAPGSSEYLLWYEHPSVAHRPDPTSQFSPEFVRLTRDWGRFLGYVKRVVTHLESQAFVARLARIGAREAESVAAAVGRIRRLSTARALAMSELHLKHRLNPFRAPTAAEAAAYARLLDEEEIRAAYLGALAAAGFGVDDAPPALAAVREISVRATAPGLRVLYGIDAAHDRGLVVLGEWLDRSFYGDSVRRAEALWGAFLAGRPLAAEAASAR